MITFTEAKRQANIRKHGIDFIGAEVIFLGITISREDTRHAYGEQRMQTLGMFHGQVVVVVHTPRGEDEHIISIRKAEKHEQRTYFQYTG